MALRDKHLTEKVFTAGNGSIPKVTLRAPRFDAILNPKTSQWEGTLNAQLSLRGVTRQVRFRASLQKQGEGANVSADTVIKTSDFGVQKISYAGATVNDGVQVSVNIRVEPGKPGGQ